MANKESGNVKGYKIDFTKNTITMNYKFSMAASQYGTKEYNILKSILTDYPTMKKVVQPGRTYKHARKFKNLTYENMEKVIKATHNEALLQEFYNKKGLSVVEGSRYKLVRDWFMEVYPTIEEDYPELNFNPEEKERKAA